MTDTNSQFLDTSAATSSSHSYVQIATPKSPNSDSAWSDSDEVHDRSNGNNNNSNLKKKLTDQIDVEILLKHREYKLIEKEIRKVERTLHTLEQLHQDEKYGEYMTHLITLQRKANGILLQDQKQNHTPQAIHSDPLSAGVNSKFTITKSSLRPSTSAGSTGNGSVSSVSTTNTNKSDHRTSYGGIPSLLLPNGKRICIHRLTNGKLVKISCPVCSRTDFGSAQGFLNHARLSHQLEFKSQSDVAEKCGVELNEWEKDLWEQQQDGSLSSINASTVVEVQRKKVKLDPGEVNADKGAAKIKYLSKVVSKTKETTEFEELVKDVTSKDQMDFDDDEAESPGGTTVVSNSSVISKGHSRRKSRGGLSSVKFDDELNSALGENLSSEASTEGGSIGGSIGAGIILVGDGKLTAAQRRRVPSVPNPLRTRSRSSRENSS